MFRKYIIVLCCICAVCIVLGHTANVSYEDFVAIGNYISSDDSYVAAEVDLFSKVFSWFSMYSFEYEVELYEDSTQPYDADYLFQPPDPYSGTPGRLVLIIGIDDHILGIDDDLRRIANLLEHDALLPLPSEPNWKDYVDHLGYNILSIFALLRFIVAIVYALIILLLHALPLTLQIIRVMLYLLGFSNSLA